MPHPAFTTRFEQQVRKTPGVVAVRDRVTTLTYAELFERSTRLAAYLGEHGFGVESIVGVAMPRGCDLVVALIGVLRSGAAYLPLDPSYPSERLQHCIDDSKVRVILTRAEVAAALPRSAVALVLDDTLRQTAIAAPGGATPPDRDGLLSERAAYVIYTSGSTGIPKGIVISHRALATFIAAAGHRGCVLPGDRVLALTTVAFDISILELLVPLCYGCEVVVADVDSARDPREVVRLIDQHRPTVVQATPSQWGSVVHHTSTALENLRVLVGGEALPCSLAARLEQSAAEVINLYGPTEATVWASAAGVDRGELQASADAIVTIGTPLADYEMLVLGENHQEMPPGIAGEISVGGPALARGYCNQPRLTAERFVPNPYGGPGARMYLTGDLAMRRADGRIAFLGRNDRQVKIRGHRIELGDIEAVLRSDDDVVDATVTAHPDGQRLLAYVVCTKPAASAPAAKVAGWQSVWDSTYQRSAAAPGEFNIAGWHDSYTSTAIPASEMRAWVEETVARIAALRPRRVLEIGCGTGLLLSRLAPECESYVGVDFSPAALAFVKAHIAATPALAHVQLRQGEAHDLSFVTAASCDLVIINSVVQYFPDMDYLLRALAEAARVSREGGKVFVGDVRNLALMEAFRAEVQMHRAPDALPTADLRRRAAAVSASECELLVAPQFFHALAGETGGIARVDIAPKTGGYDNELRRFRYDVVLTIGRSRVAVARPTQWIGWDEQGRWRQAVAASLETLPEMSIGVRQIPDRRVSRAIAVSRLLTSGQFPTVAGVRRASASAVRGQDAEELLALAQAFAAPSMFTGVDSRGTFDVVFNPRWRTVRPRTGRGSAPLSAFVNQPARDDGGRRVAALRARLRTRLPPYMVPAAIVELDRLPLTPNGKLDRRALPAPRFTSTASYEAPTSVDERTLCQLFEEVLGLPVVGVHDQFFELGGHSLSAATLALLVQSHFHTAVSMQTLFEAPTVAALARHLRQPASARTPARHVVALRPGGSLPPLFCLPPVYGLSFAYAGLARELDPERPIYCLQASGVRDDDAFAVDVREATAHYVAAIRSVEPKGPYHLFGWSFGGLMAHAVACQLQRQEDEIASLAIVDAYPRALSVHGRLGNIAHYLAGIREHLDDAVTEHDRLDIDRLLRLTVNHAMFMAAFKPERFDGNMLLVSAQDNHDLRLLWQPFVSGTITTRSVACRHMQMMTLEQLRVIGPLVEADAKAATASRHGRALDFA